MLSPVIGITMYGKNEVGEYYLQSAYVDAIRRAGGIPILLPSGELNPHLLLTKIDGLILAGGGDIDPQIYNGKSHPKVYAVNPERDRFELELAKLALTQNLPILGICRGMQILNVVDGGDLVVHIPDRFGNQIAHRNEIGAKDTVHQVEIITGSKVAIAMGVTNTQVSSMHHQAVLNVSPNWQVVATSIDGVIEAIEHKTHPWAIAVQWHPEMSNNDLAQQGLFKALVKETVSFGMRSAISSN
jgi:putative glutamine amidotransferase